MVHKPALLILDEPTAGLDPMQIVEMRKLIRQLRGEHTLLISSHFLAEISQTCDRLLVIQNGEIVAQGSEEDLATTMGTAGDVEISVRGPADKAVPVIRAVVGVVAVTVVSQQGGEASLRVQTREDIRPTLVRALVSNGLDLVRLDRASSRLESIFIQLARSGQDGGPAVGSSDSAAAGGPSELEGRPS
jgi:ABC-2 type transport system ATP-binding protein